MKGGIGLMLNENMVGFQQKSGVSYENLGVSNETSMRVFNERAGL